MDIWDKFSGCWTKPTQQHSNQKSNSTQRGCSVGLYVGMNSVSFEQTIFTFGVLLKDVNYKILKVVFLSNVGKKHFLYLKKLPLSHHHGNG